MMEPGNQAGDKTGFDDDGDGASADASVLSTKEKKICDGDVSSDKQKVSPVNYKDQYEKFCKTHPRYVKKRSPDFCGSGEISGSVRHGSILLAVVVVIFAIAIGIHSKIRNSDSRPLTNAPLVNQESSPSAEAKEDSPEQADKRLSKAKIFNDAENGTAQKAYFKFKISQVPPDCTVKLTNLMVTLPDGNHIPAQVLNMKLEGNELTVWTMDAYPVDSSLECDILFVPKSSGQPL